MDERIKVLAHNLVNYSMDVKPGDKVYVHYIGAATQDLARQLVKEVYKAEVCHSLIIPMLDFKENCY